MPNLKEVRSRIQSVASTQQITKAMKMVAAAKLRRSQERIMQMRPYSVKLNVLFDKLSQSATLEQNPYTDPRPNAAQVLIVVITSDRGLCGAFNTNIVRAAWAAIQTKYSAQYHAGHVSVLCIGKKGLEFFARKPEVKLIERYVNLFGNLNFVQVSQAADFIMESYTEFKYDQVEIIYNEFKNVATQIIRNHQFLPITDWSANSDAPAVSGPQTDYLFEPSSAFILNELIPKTLKVQLYKALLDSNASENGARMTAMDKATDNAAQMLKDLKLIYNRSRQASITKEILEIVGGAEALKNA